MIRWVNPWKPFNRDGDYYLGELHWEIEENPKHPLHGKRLRIEGWIPEFNQGYSHFIVFLKGDGRYAYVLLIWQRDESNLLPYCEFLNDTDAVNRFVDKWAERSTSKNGEVANEKAIEAPKT